MKVGDIIEQDGKRYLVVSRRVMPRPKTWTLVRT